MAKPNVVNKKKLLEAAKAIIAEHGMEKLTLKAVAESAEVTQGTVYYHFKTKDQLLLEVTESFCKASWEQIGKDVQLEKALQSAESRCVKDSMYHHLFFQLVASGLQNDAMKDKIGGLLHYENQELKGVLNKKIGDTMTTQISTETLSILCNALIDGLALQALFNPSFSTDKVYGDLYTLLEKFSVLQKGGNVSE
ncbi:MULTISPECIES: TetR/AcrR family transcriptional regulator [Bacillus]|uniref:TetR family transcriptional regulator n=2 Tax=Bacillus cereus group TaxID=86661 RepID=A0A1C4C9P7_BACTU|nr:MULTISPECIES: TetR/AcrR family transcriptional regulator [Bacillus cereus group]MDP1456661.1 TetR/AcrR family transcriptional regulator [Bacillus wiedmannii]MED2013982.1 TetR/AcrR family transcriptional regulator [Bacillus wiedmannii]MED3021061.1 TetR/AcrR family transcriptional regulator [Bacillus wiedmannii]OTX95929.1 TetR family transcriptional regulator [Bacillus thuringiensis serovar wratislaviensis]OUB63444.1 TetR family transcriptional regulator [Bacillus thuringiensis serovar sylves